MATFTVPGPSVLRRYSSLCSSNSAQQGMETLGGTAAEAAAHIARETEIWKKVIADAGIRLE